MNFVFANNQAIMAASGVATAIYTDPVALRGMDRISAVMTLNAIFNAAAPGLGWYIEVSNDGTTWLTFAGSAGDASTVSTESFVLTAVAFAYMRFVFTLTGTGGGTVVGGCMFDCHAQLDKQGA